MITVDVSKTVAELTDKLGRLAYVQMPFAASVALNKTADDIQRREVSEMRNVFDRPTQYILNSVVVKKSTKQTLRAEIGLKDRGAGVPASKYLAAHIGGGSRRPKRFESALRAAGHLPGDLRAVPGAGAKIDQYGNMATSQMNQILSFFRAFPEAAKGARQNMTDRKRQRLAKGTKSQRGFEYFIGRPGGRSPLGVYQRISFARGYAIKPVLIFVRQARYKAIFDFKTVAQETVLRDFGWHFEKALADAMRTAR
jgi:hypothetical protein